MHQLADSVADTAREVGTASGGARRAADLAGDGRSLSDSTERAMEQIARSSDDISRIVSVIDDIAFQTNLLALNAGVEAARAGDAGRGFAVVATEVRALAQRSAKAAAEVEKLVSVSSENVRQGVDFVAQAQQGLNAIVVQVEDLTAPLARIARSTQSQAEGLGEVSRATQDLDEVTRRNASLFEETMTANEMLMREISELANLIERFDIEPRSHTGVDRYLNLKRA